MHNLISRPRPQEGRGPGSYCLCMCNTIPKDISCYWFPSVIQMGQNKKNAHMHSVCYNLVSRQGMYIVRVHVYLYIVRMYIVRVHCTCESAEVHVQCMSIPLNLG